MRFTQPNGRDGVRQVVPIDHEPRAAPARHQPGHRQRRHGRRILHQHHVRLRQSHQQREEVPGLPHDPRQRAGDEAVETARGPSLKREVWQTMTRDPRVTGRCRHGWCALEADQVDIMPGIGQRDGVILHSRAAAQISEYDNGGSHVTVYLLLSLSSAVLVLLLTPLVSRGSIQLGLVDAPGGRKVHPQSVPRLGGVAVVAAMVMAIILVSLWRPEDFGPAIWPALQPLAAAGALIFGIGLLDDLRGVGAGTKVAIQVSAAVLVMTAGLLIERVTLLGMSWQLGWLAWPITAAWIVGLTNAFNLIDGIDGLASGIAAIAGAACGLVLIMRGHSAEAMLLATLVGAAVGFLFFNFSPASIFLGDSGSLLFGFLLATTAIAGWQKGATALATGVPLLIFALPLADIMTTILRRSLARPTNGPASLVTALRQLVEPDRQHIHHRLLALGWSPRRTVLILYGVTAVLSVFALSTAQAR